MIYLQTIGLFKIVLSSSNSNWKKRRSSDSNHTKITDCSRLNVTEVDRTQGQKNVPLSLSHHSITWLKATSNPAHPYECQAFLYTNSICI